MEPKAALRDLFFMMINGRQFLPTPHSFPCHHSRTSLCDVLFVPVLGSHRCSGGSLLTTSLPLHLVRPSRYQMCSLDRRQASSICTPPFITISIALMSIAALGCPWVLVHRRIESGAAGSQGSLRILTVVMMGTVLTGAEPL